MARSPTERVLRLPRSRQEDGGRPRTRLKRGDYDVTTDDRFATRLTEISRSQPRQAPARQFQTRCACPRLRRVANPGTGQRPRAPQSEREWNAINCGFQKVESLPPNIGYLKFNMFADPDNCGPPPSAAMNFLGNVDAISSTCATTAAASRR